MTQAHSSQARLRGRNPRAILTIPLLLLAAAPVLALAASAAFGAPAGTNTLSVGSASGVSGSDVTVPLDLANGDPVGGLQLDIVFDSTAVSFINAVLTSRTIGMSLGSSVPAAGRLRVLMYFAGRDTLTAGDGAVANLSFHIIGTTSTTLIPDAVELSSPTGEVIPGVTANPGAITLGDPTGACCTVGGTCAVTTAGACAAPNTWLGAGTTCSPNSCLQPPGACCSAAGACTVTAQAACAGGTWRGAGTACTPNPCPVPPAADTLAIGAGSGPPGGQVTVPLSLKNHVAVRGLQADVQFDPAVLTFVSGTAATRAGAMQFDASSPATGRARVVMYFIDASVLAAGEGPVADLVFLITGAAESRSSLAPSDIRVAGENNTVVATVGSAGEITVASGPAPPDLRLAALKNPGRTRTLQLFLSSDVALDNPPTVSAGGTVVTVTQTVGANIYQGSISLPDGTTTITVQASGSHNGITGTAETTVTF